MRADFTLVFPGFQDALLPVKDARAKNRAAFRNGRMAIVKIERVALELAIKPTLWS